MNLQPYQAASQETKRQEERPLNAIKNAALTGLAGAGVISKILPFLNKFVPTNLAIKGISKVNPTLGKFISGSIAANHPAEEVMDFVRKKLQPEEEKEVEQQPQQPESLQSMSQRGELLTPPPGRGFPGSQPQGQQPQGQPQQQKQKSQIDDQILAAFEKVLRM